MASRLTLKITLSPNEMLFMQSSNNTSVTDSEEMRKDGNE